MTPLQKSIAEHLSWKPYASLGSSIVWQDQQGNFKNLDDLPTYTSLGWSNQHQDDPTFWSHYRAHEWQRVTQTNSYTLEVCHETKEFLETDSSD